MKIQEPTRLNLEELIQQMFPLSAFDSPNYDLSTAIKAYELGFKDGYARSDSNVILEVVQTPTARERLYAAYKERIEDQSRDGEILRKETR